LSLLHDQQNYRTSALRATYFTFPCGSAVAAPGSLVWLPRPPRRHPVRL